VLPLESITSFNDLRSTQKIKKEHEELVNRRKGSSGIYGDKMLGSGRVRGGGIDQ